ncbi:hypothetical protein ACFZAG_41505 [Streptomyces sp. NPDC012403]|uniref:hypothetical protein n=1 Tax=Streptomyces sp. NPDC012403 TaxID=3364831 RepID=UPI0036E3ADD4
MNPTHTVLLVTVLAVCVALSALVAAAATVLARWDGCSVPASISRGAVAFGGAMTLSCAVIALLLGLVR